MNFANLLRTHAAALTVVCAPACGATSMYEAARSSGGPYNSACDAAAASHDKAVRELEYLRPDFRAQVWSTEPRPNDDGLLSEEKLFRALRGTEVRAIFVQARGGIGKTQFGKALHAEMCRTKAIFSIDFKDLVREGATQDAVLKTVAAQLGMSTDKSVELTELMTRTAWMLVVDSIDEVQPEQRKAGLEALRRVRRDSPNLQLVFLGRPSIYDQYYGMDDMDGVFEIAPLDCGRARSAVLRKAADNADTDRMGAFISTWRLDRQSLIGQQCYLPMMATYRDLEAVQRLAKDFDAAKDRGGQNTYLAQVHEAILAERIRKELAELKMTPEQAFSAIDKMLQKDGYVDGEWNLGFSVKRCLAAEGGDSPTTKHLCEELYQSVVFERIGGHKGTVKGAEWQFSHQSLADLFVSRWIDAELGKAGNCKAVEDQAKMFPGKEVAGYLVGRTHGQKCLGAVLAAACGEGAQPEDLKEQIRKGLPADAAARDAAVQAAKAAAAGKGNACVDKLLAKM
ncbi:MAG: hypothetical protein EXR77_15870 [Myxococcales bacterium]|nr:hypothetical protein [Myxococcales bacterium]